MNINERLAKAESLDKDIREKFLFKYLMLKSEEKELDENVKFEAFARFISYISENFGITKDNLSKFIDDFENDYRKSGKFNDYIFYLFVAYVLKEV